MKENQSSPNADNDTAIEEEIRRSRKFTLAEAIGRLAGPGAMKGESPVPRMRQAEIEIGSWLRTHLTDAGGALEVVLHRYVKESELLLKNFDEPLAVLACCCERLLESDNRLKELVRQADVEWGRAMGERPFFEKDGTRCHSDDPYTVASVRNALTQLLKQLADDITRRRIGTG